MNNKIVVNDDYTGLTILDFNLNELKKIPLSPYYMFYDAIVVGDKYILLICEDDGVFVVVNIETDKVRIFSKPLMLKDDILKECISCSESTAILKSYRGVIYSLDLNLLCLNLKQDKIAIGNEEGEQSGQNACNIAMGKYDVCMDDQLIVIKGKDKELRIIPQTGFYNKGICTIKKNEVDELVILCGSGDASMALLIMADIIDE